MIKCPHWLCSCDINLYRTCFKTYTADTTAFNQKSTAKLLMLSKTANLAINFLSSIYYTNIALDSFNELTSLLFLASSSFLFLFQPVINSSQNFAIIKNETVQMI